MNTAAKEPEKALHLFIPEVWHDWLRDKAHADRIAIAELVRVALERTYPELPPRLKEA